MNNPISVHNATALIKKFREWGEAIVSVGGSPRDILEGKTLEDLIALENNGISVRFVVDPTHEKGTHGTGVDVDNMFISSSLPKEFLDD